MYNEEEGILHFIEEMGAMSQTFNKENIEFDLLLVDDGSSDETLDIVKNSNATLPIAFLELSRNFGHQAAVWAGIENSNSESFIVVMDADLQDHPREILRIVEAFQDGADVVLMRRRTRKDRFWKKQFASVYYRLQSKIIGNRNFRNIGDFYGISPRAKLSLLQYQEEVKYIRGIVACLGYNQRIIEYDRLDRFAGKTHYSPGKMFTLAVAGITGFSVQPLIWVVYFALGGSGISFIGAIYVIYLKLDNSIKLQPGWAFLSVSLLLLFSLVLISLASISLYLARVVQESKKRPVYITKTYFDPQRKFQN
jgi:dolichol-phosphate mannosyltransferase